MLREFPQRQNQTAFGGMKGTRPPVVEKTGRKTDLFLSRSVPGSFSARERVGPRSDNLTSRNIATF